MEEIAQVGIRNTRAALSGLILSHSNRAAQHHSTSSTAVNEVLQFQAALKACIQKFDGLGKQIEKLYNANIDKILEVFDLPKLWGKFQGMLCIYCVINIFLFPIIFHNS